jgi:hypothetical protein
MWETRRGIRILRSGERSLGARFRQLSKTSWNIVTVNGSWRWKRTLIHARRLGMRELEGPCDEMPATCRFGPLTSSSEVGEDARDEKLCRSMTRPRKQPTNKPDDADEAMSWAVDKVRNLRRSIQKATGKIEDVWFGNLLLGILNCASLDYYSAKVGAEKSVYLAAWACRNLLELRVITAYVLASEANASNFQN